MFAYDDLVQWCKDRCSDQANRRNRPWCRGRDHGRAVSAVAVRHVVAVAVITAALGVRRAWPSCRGFCVAVVWLRHADECCVCNGFGGVCVDLICLTFARRV